MDLPGRRDLVRDLSSVALLWQVHIVAEDAHAQLDTLVADIGARAGDQPPDLVLMLAAEGAADGLFFVVSCHNAPHCCAFR